MKKLQLLSLFLLLGMTVFMLSCSKDDGPTAPDTPNFENFAPYMWDYNSVLWFDLDYQDTKSGIAEIDVFITAKGINSSATLKINDIPVIFDDVDSYTNGRVYSGGDYATGSIQISTTQPVTYKIVYKEDASSTGEGKTYEGQIALPAEVNGNYNFNPNTNFSPNWTMGTGNTNPNFILVDALIEGTTEDSEWKYLTYLRQLPGNSTYDTLQSTFWQSLDEVNYFEYEIEPVVYQMKDKNKLLTVGMSYDYYSWPDLGKQEAPSSRSRINKVLEAIHTDANK